jgi:hypothetical protein
MKILFALCFAIVAAAQSQDPKDLQLFLLIGQSNMAGRGIVEAQDRVELPRIFMLNKALEWVPAVDPLHFDKPTVAGVGVGRSFAKLLVAEDPSASIGLIPCAFGGTSLDQWKRGGELYKSVVERTRQALKAGRLRGILWHQGESDSGKEETAKSYGARFAELMRNMREDLNAPDVPVVVGQLGEFHSSGFSAVVNEQLALVSLSVPHAAFVSSAGLVHKGDQVHFDAASQREYGRRYAHVFLSLDANWKSTR